MKLIQEVIEIIKARKYNDAKIELEKIINSKKDDFHAHHVLGVVFAKLNNFDQAIHNINLSVKINPKNKGAYFELGNIYRIKGNKIESKDNFIKALKIDPNSPQAHNAFGLVYQLEGDDEQADIHFKKATADQSYSRAFNNYGAYLFTQGRYQEAIEKLEVAANDRFYENRPLVFENLGVAYLQMNNQEAAEQAFTRATRLNPNQSRALLELAHIRYDEKNYVESRYFYRQFVGSSQQNARSLLLCVRISRIFDDTDSEASCELTLKNIFPVSEEYKQLEASK